MANDVAPNGYVFVCTNCGKLSRDRYGEQKISSGWDVSCAINAHLFKESDLVVHKGRVKQVKEFTVKPSLIVNP